MSDVTEFHLVLPGPDPRRWRAAVDGSDLVVATGGAERRIRCRDPKAARARLDDAVRQMRALGYRDDTPVVEVARGTGSALELAWGGRPTAFAVHATCGEGLEGLVVRNELGYVRFLVLRRAGEEARVMGAWDARWGRLDDARATIRHPAGDPGTAVVPPLVHVQLSAGFDAGREALVYVVADVVLAGEDVVLHRQRDYPVGMGKAFLGRIGDTPTANHGRRERLVDHVAVIGPDRCRFEVRRGGRVLDRDELAWDPTGKVFR